jgi:hypothetical protein
MRVGRASPRSTGVMRQRLTTFVVVFLLAIAGARAGFAQQSNQALVIGNAAYPDADAPLKEPVTDARALGDAQAPGIRRHHR